MKTELFEKLLESVKEAGAILRGEKKPSRRFVEDLFMKEGGKYYYDYVHFGKTEVQLDGWFSAEQLRLIADTLDGK